MAVDLGFETQDMFLATVRTSASTTTRETNLVLIDRIRDRLLNIPGVQAVSYVRMIPPFAWSREFIRTSGNNRPVVATVHVVGPDYFEVLGLSLTAGRAVTNDDRDRSNVVAVINQNLASTLWPAESAIGRTMTFGVAPSEAVFGRTTESAPIEIVGVAPNAFVAGFNPEQPDPRPHLIFVMPQSALAAGRRGDPGGPGEATYYIRHAHGVFEGVASAIGPALQEIDPNVAIAAMRTMDGQLEGVTLTARVIARLLAVFSVVSLLIAAIGQYAVIAFSMRRRVREFGVRIALGASARQVLTGVLGEGFALTAIGLVSGLLLSVGAATAARRALFGVTPTDARTYVGVLVLLGVVALIACCLPARAATRVDPVSALRQE
jgi:hypothetical protein